MREKYTLEQFKQAVKESSSIRQALQKLEIVGAGGNYKIFHRKIKEYNLDTSHFHGQGWRKGFTRPIVEAKPLSFYMTKNSQYQSYQLKNRLLKEGMKERVCENCHLTEWLGLPIPLELHHKNGDNTDATPENIELNCPNCHALTPNYRGKNKLN